MLSSFHALSTFTLYLYLRDRHGAFVGSQNPTLDPAKSAFDSSRSTKRWVDLDSDSEEPPSSHLKSLPSRLYPLPDSTTATPRETYVLCGNHAAVAAQTFEALPMLKTFVLSFEWSGSGGIGQRAHSWDRGREMVILTPESENVGLWE